jgi:hypothetical protein
MSVMFRYASTNELSTVIRSGSTIHSRVAFENGYNIEPPDATTGIEYETLVGEILEDDQYPPPVLIKWLILCDIHASGLVP